MPRALSVIRRSIRISGIRVIQGLGKKIVEFKDLDAALLHLQCEIVVVFWASCTQMTSSKSRSWQLPGG